MSSSIDKPPPCTLFYLSNCKHGAECKYGHNYLLQPEHLTEIRVSAKKSPCPSRNKGEVWTGTDENDDWTEIVSRGSVSMG